ncbi:cell division protein ZipA [Pseudothauera rhizosphaerae]|uniref:Cell division protein ZipA n=1 Tax=Pseudothauera rhizosphaerae TaxID=2565932 RepID=A0A4S4AAH3_9RHOO|nr:cell division protein ZipA C-terminal FtsZ-binding domain-containing protein [Pseudothauera rhizosphaerae]THF55872.1 ZipA [Pseudothauera rhizosphaerae]
MDSELQIGLIAAGAALVVLIIAYNKWQERKHRRHAEQAFKSDHRDVLLEPREGEDDPGDDRREPTFAEALRDAEEFEDEPQPAAPRAVSEPSSRRASPEAPDVLDERVDCIVRIESIEPLDVSRLWSVQREQLDGIAKPVRWFAFDDAQNLWRPLTAHSAGSYHWFCVAMQLVDRRGPIGEADFARFSGGVQRIADQFLAVPAALPARAETLSAATDLDRFCADLDVQIGINVVSTGQPFPGTKLRGLAEAQGLALEDDGSFHARDDDGNTLYSLGNLEPALFTAENLRTLQTNGITLVIDVPRVANGAQAFDRMMQFARQLADTLQGSVVDDNRHPLGTEAAALIRSQIAQFHDRMAGSEIPAGSVLARRLFAA